MKVQFPITIPERCPFGLQNIPFGNFSTAVGVGLGLQRRAGTAIGDWVLDLDVLIRHGIFDNAGLTKPLENVFQASDLNAFASLPSSDRSRVRAIIIQNLSSGSSALFTDEAFNTEAFVPLDQVQMHLPLTITDYTDFLSSYVHSQNCLRPLGIPIPAAFNDYPMGYNGRISSISVSGIDVVRPKGYFRTNKSDAHPGFQPTQELDFEVELGAFIAKPVEPGKTVNAANAAEHIFGYVLLNDWSARDIQKHEMAPLGPFHSKSFLTSVSPWVVTLDALRGSPCKAPASNCSEGLEANLRCDGADHGLFDIDLSVNISRNGSEDVQIVRTNLNDAHWSPYQMVAYQSSSGCGMHTGDLLGSGTLSLPEPGASKSIKGPKCATYGCLAEVHAVEHTLPDVGGKPMIWLEDGDRLRMEGWFRTAGGGKIGFGSLVGLVTPSRYD